MSEDAWSQMMQRVRADPIALLVGVEHIALGIGPQAAR